MSAGNSSGFRVLGAGVGSSLGLTRPQRQAVFRTMVVGEFTRGSMSRRRWQRLVQYAALLDLSAVEAGELIAQARESADGGEAQTRREMPAVRAAQANVSWPLWAKVSLACALLAVADAAVFHWVF